MINDCYRIDSNRNNQHPFHDCDQLLYSYINYQNKVEIVKAC